MPHKSSVFDFSFLFFIHCNKIHLYSIITSITVLLVDSMTSTFLKDQYLYLLYSLLSIEVDIHAYFCGINWSVSSNAEEYQSTFFFFKHIFHLSPKIPPVLVLFLPYWLTFFNFHSFLCIIFFCIIYLQCEDTKGSISEPLLFSALSFMLIPFSLISFNAFNIDTH